MRRAIFTLVALLLLLPVMATSKKQMRSRAEVLSRSRGYYKEIFMDGGVALTSLRFLPSSRFLGTDVEFFASAQTKELTQKDTLLQAKIFCGDENDTNGWLLYPDGAPRFRVLYVNGGWAARHARSMGSEAAKNIQSFIANGGSYIGTCAGAYVGSKGGINSVGKPRFEGLYWSLWPGYAQNTLLRKGHTDLDLPAKSPLLRYFDFGGNKKVENVRHNNGCFAHNGKFKDMPSKTEILARYEFDNTDTIKINEEAAIWAYKDSNQSGRVILCGSHPEGVTEGERLELMSAMILYAMDGNATPQPKGLLEEGKVREMNKRTEDNAPAYTRIGDKQYHHFELNIPHKCKRATITLDGYEGEDKFDLTLCAKQGGLAYHDNTTLKEVAKSCKKSLTIEKPKAGKWFVSVFCETTVSALKGKYGTYYTGEVEVLNGVPYKISVEYE